MFQWADGGSLRDFYSKNARPNLDVKFIRCIFQQLAGLADALDKLHNYKKHNEDRGSYRHGDLKPENILRFENGTPVGLLKISDLGLAKHHIDETGLRGPTATRYGTALYEPPEVFLEAEAARSRRYDIWSMGCIILELIVWLLYGYEELTKFNNGMNRAFGNSSPYWVIEQTAGKPRHARVHPNVVDCMTLIGQDLKRFGPTAVGDLLNIVKSMLLVVPLGATFGQKSSSFASSSVTPPGYRANAKGLFQEIEAILKKSKSDKDYWCPSKFQTHPRGPVDSIPSAHLLPNKNVPTVEARQEVSRLLGQSLDRSYHRCDQLRVRSNLWFTLPQFTIRPQT